MPGECLQPSSIETQLSFLRMANRASIDEAIQAHGEIMTAGEAAALKSLDEKELGSLLEITEKITQSRLAGGLVAADDWTCVNVVC